MGGIGLVTGGALGGGVNRLLGLPLHTSVIQSSFTLARIGVLTYSLDTEDDTDVESRGSTQPYVVD